MTNEEAIEIIKRKTTIPNDDESFDTINEAFDMAIKALEQEPILDKIRAEIEKTASRYTISRERGGMGQVEWADRLIREADILQIIDKYRKEQK